MSKMHSAKKLVIDFILVMLGNAIMALGTAGFAVPAKIILGGASGLALSFQHYVFYVHLSTLVLGINVIAFIAGYFLLGKKFAVGTLVSTFAFPFFLAIFEKSYYLTHLTKDTLLAAVYAGFLIGVGLGLVLRLGYSTGGMDIPPLLVNKYTGLALGLLINIFDIIILIIQIPFSDVEEILYGIITVVISTYIIDKMMLLGQNNIQVIVVSEKYEEIAESLMKDVDRGCTLLNITTGFMKNDSKAVMVVLNRREYAAFHDIVQNMDPEAFEITSEVHSVNGRGFTLPNVNLERWSSKEK